MLKVFEEIKIKPISWMKAGFYTCAIILVYYSALKQMVFGWNKEDYSYCYLIPFVVLYLIWEKRRVLNNSPSSPSWVGFIPFGLGVVFFWLGELGGEFLTLYISFWLITVGIIWNHLGWGKIKVLAFSLFMILTMFPLPDFLYKKISLNLQLISTKLGVALVQIYGMSAYREGNIIDLGFTQLQVVEACSGLRYLISLVILSILLAYFFKGSLWKRAIIVVSSIPTSIMMNSLRIALTGILYEVWGAKVAEGFFHGFSGWLIFLVALGIMLAEMWLLGKIAPALDGRQKNEIQNSKLNIQDADLKTSNLKPETQDSKPKTLNLKPKTLRTFFSPPQFIVAIILLGATLAFSYGIEFREKIPIKKSFDLFPLRINEWSGTRETMEQKFIDTLDFSDYVIIDYKDKAGKQVNFYVAYYESQRKGESIHSPETCLPGGGWEFREAGTVNIPIAQGKTDFVRVNRAFMAKPGANQLVYFWFPQRGRILTNAYQLKIYTFWDALTRQRTDGALVRIITPVYPNEQSKDAEARLQGFTREIAPVLEEFIPN